MGATLYKGSAADTARRLCAVSKFGCKARSGSISYHQQPSFNFVTLHSMACVSTSELKFMYHELPAVVLHRLMTRSTGLAAGQNQLLSLQTLPAALRQLFWQHMPFSCPSLFF